MYTVLGPNLLPIGSLSINGNSKGTKFWGDTISQQIADDGSSDDPSTSLSMTANKIDTQANHKLWNHTITINFDNDDLGGQIISGYYLVYYDDVSLRYYLMNLTNVKESPQGGYRTATGSNAAIYDMAGIKPAKKSFTQASLTQILTYIFDDVTWSLKVEPNGVLIDYDIDGTKTVQSILQELQIKFSTEVDAYITLNSSGMIDERIVEVKKMGSNKGTLIRDGSSNNGYESIVRTSVSDTLYTKFYISGVTDETNPDYGSITSVNNGLNYIVDDDANRKYNPVGASQGSYREVSLENTILKEPTALFDWGKEQVQLFNHPRYNYTVISLHDMQASLGDTVAIQDLKAIPEILITSRVIQRTFSFSSPETNTLVFGEFSNLNIVSDVTSETITVLKKQVTIAHQIANNAINTADEAKQTAINAQESADGKGAVLTLKSKDDLPESAVNGTQAWVETASGTYHYVFIDGDWVEDISPTMQKDITDKVTASLTEAKNYSDKLVADNNTQINNTINEVSQEKIDLALKNADFNENAQAMADKALANAKANAAQVAQEALNSANQNLADARKSLTDGIASEASARNAAVATANSQAQTYANQAKADALNTIAKEVSDRQNAVSALDTKATNAVNQAKSDINDTIKALSVGDRNYILDTANPKTQTSNGKDNQDFRGSATFYSPIKNWGIANGDYIISFDWTLKTALSSDMQASVFFNQSPWQPQHFTVKSGQLTGHVDLKFKLNPGILTATQDVTSLTFRIMSQMASGNTITYSNLFMKSGTIITTWTPAPEDVVLDYTTKDNQIKETISQYQTTNDGKVTKAQTDATTALGQVATKVSQTDYDTKTGDLTTKYTQVKQTVDSQATDIVNIKKTATSQASKINSISSDVDGTKQSISDIETTQDSQSNKINQITSDVNGTKQSITDIQTKDGKQDSRMGTIETSVSGVKSDFSSYKTTNDGAVKTAQTTAQTAVDGLKTKVSQTDYNTKTGKLQTDLTETSQTANQAKTDIVAIKSEADSQSAQINDIVSDAKGTKQTISDIKTEQGKQSGSIATLKSRADGFEATVTKVNNLAVGGTNLVSGTNQEYKMGYGIPNTTWQDGYAHLKLPTNVIRGEILPQSPHTFFYTMSQGTTYTQTIWFETDATVKDLSMAQITWYTSVEHDNQPTIIQKLGQNSYKVISTYTWPGKTDNNVRLFDIRQLDLAFNLNTGTYLKFGKLKLEKGNVPTDWSPAPEDTENKISTVSQTVDSISSIVSDPTTGLTKRVQTAEGLLNQVRGTDIPKLQKATFWQHYSSLNFNDYTKQGSFFFSTIAVKTNGPVSWNNSWLYLIVEQVTSAKDRIKQTAWYDGVTGVKITYVRTLNSGTWSPWYANDNDSVTTISQTNESIKTEISNRQTGDTNTLTQAKDFTSSQISNSETNMKSLINQKADSVIVGTISNSVDQLKSVTNWQEISYNNLDYLQQTGNYLITQSDNTNFPPGVKAWVYIKVESPRSDRVTQTLWKDLNATQSYVRTYDGTNWSAWGQQVTSSTLLSIFKDSWSLGTSVNNDITNQMVSGIVGNASQMSLISKKVIIDSPSTQINGTAWIKSAMIANGAIGTAQIGEAAIGNAQISAVDAAKITSGLINTQRLNVGEVFAQGINTTNATIGKTLTIGSGGAITWSLNGSVQNFSTNPYWVYGRTDGGKGAYVFDASQSGTANINTNGSFDFTGTISSPSSSYNGKTVYAYPVDGAGLWGTGGSYQSSLYSQSRYGVDGLILKTYKDSSMSSGYANWAKISSYSISMGTDISNPGVILESDGDITALGTLRLVQDWKSGSVGNNASLQFTGTNFWLNTAGNSYINPQGYVRLASSGGNGSVTYVNDTYGIETSKGIKTGSLYTRGGTAVYTTDGSTIYFLNGKAGGRNNIAVKSVSQSSLVSQKTNIGNVDTGYALNEVLKADVRSYSFIDDEDKQIHVSPMIDDVDNKMYIPKDWLDSEHEGVDTYSVIGYLIQAVKELNKKIEQLEQA